MKTISLSLSQLHNKLFKSDSQRVAFLLCVGFSVLGGMRELRYCVAHTLTGRYGAGKNSAKGTR
ncbi:DUF3265 domain-containing protein [Vibrio parahaemolyticus]|nr:DUF3265 domain-containing protein [Vibrio parahaemolyticus]ELB2167912.1 DUF3265 domain-containing protein [Vibrio parahaemolyticus]ELB2189747.1 DUF3265 domain-containing protein [Vibrio parahaemolyticus]ELB2194862.1 DUF3265 domain-containing protein [Vibrio parahaemolyticus]ELB2214951.1 DUF3265 domain-containing protein [Vibrio parahaemolyticus]